MAEEERNGIPSGLNRIRTRLPAEELSSSGGDDTPSVSGRPAEADGKGKGLRKGRKIARWLTSYFVTRSSSKDSNTKTNSKRDTSERMLGKEHIVRFDHSIEQNQFPGLQSLPESSFLNKTSKGKKSFSHELGPKGGIRPAPIRARSYNDLKELLGSLDLKLDTLKEAVNVDLAAFSCDVKAALEKDSLTMPLKIADGLLSLSQQCIEMTCSQFRDSCERIVQNLAERRHECQTILVKQLVTRMLFILTHFTRLLQLQKDNGLIDADSLTKFKQCLESVPAVEMNLIPKARDSVCKLDDILKQNNHSKSLKTVKQEIRRSLEMQNEEFSLDYLLEQELNSKQPDSVICRICEKSVPITHLESHSYICAYADKCELEGFDVDERLVNIAEILDQIVESYSQSIRLSCGSTDMSRMQPPNTGAESESHSPKVLEWHNKGREGMFEDIHEMDTAFIDDLYPTNFINLKAYYAIKLGHCRPESSNESTTPISPLATPTSSHFDLYWLEHNNPSEPEDVTQISELANISRRVANIDNADEGAFESFDMYLHDLTNILKKKQAKALIIDTFGSHIKELLKEKYLLAIEIGKEKSSRSTSQAEDDKGHSEVNASQSSTLAPLHPSYKERTNIDDFEILKPISKGAFGRVFLARKRTTGDLFAIKALKKLDIFRKNDVDRILAERNILITVRNPFVVRFFYSFTSRDNLYLVMEYLNGGDLYSLLRNVGCLEEEVARVYIAELVLALEYLHSLGIVHRDLKPDNILIARDGHIKLTDFGLSKIGLINTAIHLSGSATDGSVPLDAYAEQAQEGGKRSRSVVGTPDYLAPEILLGTAHGFAADWWSVGIVLFELVVGIPPFTARLPEMIFENILNGKIPWPHVPDEMSYETKDLIDRLLVQDPKLRLGTNGASEVKSHSFFKEIDWENLALQKAAFIPNPDSADDTSYFISRFSQSLCQIPDDNCSDFYSATTSSSSGIGTEINMDKCGELVDFESQASADLSSINFSFKNLSQLASMNYDVLLQGGKTSNSTSPS